MESFTIHEITKIYNGFLCKKMKEDVQNSSIYKNVVNSFPYCIDDIIMYHYNEQVNEKETMKCFLLRMFHLLSS